MKFHWGAKIVLIYGIFVLAVVSMVLFSMTKDIDLVSEKYYDEGIGYQDKISEIERSKSLPEPVSYTLSDSFLIVQFPRMMDYGRINGTLVLFRPSDRRKDKKISLRLNESNQMVLDVSNLTKGLWKLKTEWKFNQDSYYNEEVINIQ
ncbi:MAG: FixH family protein [Bacillota bacterium]